MHRSLAAVVSPLMNPALPALSEKTGLLHLVPRRAVPVGQRHRA